MTVTLSVNGQSVAVESGSTVLDAINSVAIPLPQLCKDPDQERLGTCRTCLVSIENVRGAPASCQTVAEDGMVVRTDDPVVTRIRDVVLQLTLDMMPEDDPARLGELGMLALDLELKPGRFTPATLIGERSTLDSSNPIWELDRSRCILCQRCISACQDIQHIYAIALLDTGSGSEIGTFRHGSLIESNCTSCGQCWSVCPTLAIRQKTPALIEGIAAT